MSIRVRRSGSSPEGDGSCGERRASRIFLWEAGFCAHCRDFQKKGRDSCFVKNPLVWLEVALLEVAVGQGKNMLRDS